MADRLTGEMAVTKMAEEIVRREGGLTADPSDRGGVTNHGVSLKYAKNVGLVKFDLDHDGDVDGDDIKLVTPEYAVVCFKEDFYFAPRIDRLPAEIQEFIFDCAVNHGAPQAIKIIQRILIKADLLPAISATGRRQDDGVLGPKSIEATKAAQLKYGNAFLNTLINERIRFFRAIAMEDPKQLKFLDGWIARAESFRVPNTYNPKAA